MKKLLTIIGLTIGLSAFADQIATNVTTGGTFQLSTNRASVYSVELTSAYPTLVRLFDMGSVAAPFYGTNYITGAYAGVASYATNYVTSFIGQNGHTNWYTNAGMFTYSTSVVAATNSMTPSASFVVAGGTYALYNTDTIFNRGIVMQVNTNVSIVINYRSGQ